MAETATAPVQVFAYSWWAHEAMQADAGLAADALFAQRGREKVEAAGFEVIGEPSVKWHDRHLILEGDPPEGWLLVVVRLEARPVS